MPLAEAGRNPACIEVGGKVERCGARPIGEGRFREHHLVAHDVFERLGLSSVDQYGVRHLDAQPRELARQQRLVRLGADLAPERVERAQRVGTQQRHRQDCERQQQDE